MGKTVAEIDQLDAAEFVRWNVWYARKAQMEELAAKGGRAGGND